MLEGRGDEIPVSQMPVDGTWPSGTAVWEKRKGPAWEVRFAQTQDDFLTTAAG